MKHPSYKEITELAKTDRGYALELAFLKFDDLDVAYVNGSGTKRSKVRRDNAALFLNDLSNHKDTSGDNYD